MTRPDDYRDEQSKNHPKNDAEHSRNGDRHLMSTISVIALGVGFAVCLSFALHYFGKEQQKAAIYWGTGAGLFAVIGVGAYALSQVPNDRQEPVAAEQHAAQRASIAFTQLKLMKAEVDFLHTSVVLTNKGNGPAKDVEASWHTIITPQRLEGRIDGQVAQQRRATMPEPQARFGPVFPGMDYTLQLTVEGSGSFPARDIERVKNGTLFVYVVGEVTYRPTDATERSVSEFCALWTPALGKYLVCREHNRTDVPSGRPANSGDSEPAAPTGPVKGPPDPATQLGQRAWIVPTTVTFVVPPIPGKYPSVRVDLHNTGKTPALDVVISNQISYYPSDAKESDLPWSLPASQSKTMIGPNQHQYSDNALIGGNSLSEGNLRDLREDRTRLFVYGTIDYVDIFKVPHFTKFCVFWNGTGDFTACPFGNDAN
jgi:hypothetical protein